MNKDNLQQLKSQPVCAYRLRQEPKPFDEHLNAIHRVTFKIKYPLLKH